MILRLITQFFCAFAALVALTACCKPCDYSTFGMEGNCKSSYNWHGEAIDSGNAG